MFSRKGYRQLREYNWIKRIVGFIISLGLVLIIRTQVPVELWHWALFFIHALIVIVWYGSQVRIDSILIGIRYSLVFIVLSIAIQLRLNPFNPWMIALGLTYLPLTMMASWSLPRVKLGLKIIKPVGSVILSSALVIVGYNVLMYFFVSKEILINGFNSLAILTGFTLLYSIYSKSNIIHFIILTFMAHMFLKIYLMVGVINWIEPIIILVLYIIFIIIQMNTKIKKKEI